MFWETLSECVPHEAQLHLQRCEGEKKCFCEEKSQDAPTERRGVQGYGKEMHAFPSYALYEDHRLGMFDPADTRETAEVGPISGVVLRCTELRSTTS